MKRWHKVKNVIRVNPITRRDAIAKENEQALIECARYTKRQRLALVRQLQNLISGVLG